MIRIEHMYKTYVMGDTAVHALEDVSLHIAPQEFAAIIGPSGSGKSTLMHMIGCLDTPDSGEYWLDGEDISDMSEGELAGIRSRKIGFVFQEFNLLPKLTARQNVELPLIYQRVHARERARRVEAALAQVGLTERAEHLPSQLSGGQQQRVAIARALATDPPLLLADEPTGNLDSKAGQEILSVIENLHNQGKTVVLITHDPSVAARAQRRITVLDGHIKED